MVTKAEFDAAYGTVTNRSNAELAKALVWKTEPHKGPEFPTRYLNHEVQGSNEPLPDMWTFKLLTMPCNPKFEGLIARVQFFDEDKRPLPDEDMYERWEKLTDNPRNPLTVRLGVLPLHRGKYWSQITLVLGTQAATSELLTMRPGRIGGGPR